MKASEIIKELQDRIEVYGDWDVVIRKCGNNEDCRNFAFYGDEKDKVIVMSGMAL